MRLIIENRSRFPNCTVNMINWKAGLYYVIFSDKDNEGMIADFAIHDKEDGSPHAHILLTLRAMDEHGK